MAQATGTDTPDRSLPSWATEDGTDNVPEALQALQTYKKKDPEKGVFDLNLYNDMSAKRIVCQLVIVRFRAVGNTPIMKQNFFKITSSNRFQAVIQFLRKELGWKAGDPLVRSCPPIEFDCISRMALDCSHCDLDAVHIHKLSILTRT